MGVIDNTILDRRDKGEFFTNDFQKIQSYMADGFTTILYMYGGALFTVSCDDFQQFKVYNSLTKSCHLYYAREISLLNGDYDCKELKLFVTDRCDKYGNIIFAPIVNVVHSKVAEPVKIFSVLENKKYYIRNRLPKSFDDTEHYIEYINLLMQNEFIADVVDNGDTLKYHFKNWCGAYDNIVVIKNLVACRGLGTTIFLNIKSIDGKFKVVDEYSDFQDITPKQMMDLPSTEIDVNDINIKTAVIEYMMTNNICGRCNTKDNSIKFNNVNIELNVIKLSYVSYKYNITCDDGEYLLDEGFTEDKLYFKRIDSSDNVYTVIPAFERLL